LSELRARIAKRFIMSDLYVIAWVDVPARHHPINFRDNVTVTKVELCLNEIALGGFELGLGLYDSRGVRRQSSKRPVDITSIQVLELLEHLLG
jgi:hypothetical protein